MGQQFMSYIHISMVLALYPAVVLGQNFVPNDFKAPLEIPAVISGTFGELRPNHFHSGVDFTTNGKVGYKVVSIAEGYVSRVKISPIGYGKAVYVTHPGGYTSVYGHLERFSGKIDSVVMARQYEKQRFETDENFHPHDLPVKTGEIVGFRVTPAVREGHIFILKSVKQRPRKHLTRFFFGVMRQTMCLR
ncbi:MAG: M23 family metallopeptidase [Breznakibacter sp.]